MRDTNNMMSVNGRRATKLLWYNVNHATRSGCDAFFQTATNNVMYTSRLQNK